MIVDELEAALRIGPKFIYVLPNFQNPSGSTLSLERRHKLIELADRYGVPIVRDDPYASCVMRVIISFDRFFDSEYRGEWRHYSGNHLSEHLLQITAGSAFGVGDRPA
jgi:2-aminoadipate transaminase